GEAVCHGGSPGWCRPPLPSSASTVGARRRDRRARLHPIRPRRKQEPMRTTKCALVTLAAVLLLPLPAAAAWGQPRSGAAPPGPVDYTAPAAPRDVAPGTLVGVVGRGLRLLRVENPAGAPGCEGAPRPDLRAVRAGGGAADLFDPAPGVTLSAGGNAVFRAGAHVAVVTFCEGY